MPLQFPSRLPCPWATAVPAPERIPYLIEESFHQRSQQDSDPSIDQSKYSSEDDLRSWIATSSFNWVMRNHLIDHLQKTIDLASSPEQKIFLDQMLKQCHGWNQAELRCIRASLKTLTKDDLWSFRVWELKELARQLNRRGIKDPANPDRISTLASYTGSGIVKRQAIEGIWNALNPCQQAP